MTEKKHTILIVDDDAATRNLYKDIFEANGFSVIEAEDGVEGLDVATSQAGIDVIFTGIIMPRMDGFELMGALKKYSQTNSIPVIMNSHLGREEDRKKAMDLGARDFIIRGIVNSQTVVQKVLRALNQGSYLIDINPLGLDGQKFIEDFNLAKDFSCDNCGTSISMKVKKVDNQKFEGILTCPNCQKTF